MQELLADASRLERMSPWDHLAWAQKLPRFSEEITLPATQTVALQLPSADPDRLHLLRKEAYNYWKERKRVTEPAWQRLRGALAPHVQRVLGPDKNLLLFTEMLRACESPDVQLPHCLAHGFPLLGNIPATGTLPEKVPEDALPRQELLDEAALINSRVLDRVSREVHVASAVQRGLLQKTEEEVRAGKAEWISLASLPANAVLTPRFPADEGFKCKRGVRVRSIRAIDDFLASRINEATSLCEQVRHDSLDVLIGIAQHLRKFRGDRPRRFLLRKDDVSGAFKTLPLRREDLPCAIAVLPDSVKEGKAIQLFTCPFGAKSSVLSWHRVGDAFQRILLRLFAVVNPRFVDDHFGVDEEDDAETLVSPVAVADLCRWVIQDLLGWQLDEDKAVTAAPSAVVLGVLVSFEDSSETAVFEVPADKSTKWRSEIASVLEHGILTPAAARKLAGKLSWGATVVFQRSARVFLMPIFRHACGSRSKITQRLRCALLWWDRFLATLPKRRVPLAPRILTRLILYTDATGSGTLAWVAVLGSERKFARSRVPGALRRWALPRKHQIGTWELLAAVCALWQIFEDAPANVEILLFVDNTAAHGTLVRGSSRQEDWNHMISEIWFQPALRGHCLSAWWVPSHLNIADAPSRVEWPEGVTCLTDQGFQEVDFQWPRTLSWLPPLFGDDS